MKNVSEDFRLHISGETTSLCRCWVIETVDGMKLGFTDHDEDISLDGVNCERHAGMETSGIEERLGLNVDSSEVSGALQSDRITEQDIRAGKYDNAKVATYIVNWSQPDQWMLNQVLLVGEITQQDGMYKVEMRGLSSLLDQTRGRQFIKRCQADLGDGRCKFNTDQPQFSGNGVVTTAASSSSFTASGLEGFESGWFSFGHLSWTSGENAGTKIEVSSHSRDSGGEKIVLWQPMHAPIKPDDEFTIIAGCDKRFKTCKAKFSNANNFQGFPHIPGDRFALSYASNTSRFDGGPVVP